MINNLDWRLRTCQLIDLPASSVRVIYELSTNPAAAEENNRPLYAHVDTQVYLQVYFIVGDVNQKFQMQCTCVN